VLNETDKQAFLTRDNSE